MKRIISIILAVLMLASAAAFAEMGVASQMNNETVFNQAVALLQYYHQPESIQQAADIFSNLPGSYKQAVYFVTYAQAMLGIQEGFYEESLTQLDTLKEFNGYDDFEASLQGYGLPSCADLAVYTRARQAETEERYYDAYELYKQADVMDALTRAIELSEYKPSSSPIPLITPTPKPTMVIIDDTSNRMYIVNCNEWVSLRAYMSTSAERLAKVPLGATVTNVQKASEGFSYVTYNGMQGYIQNQYLSAYYSGRSTPNNDTAEMGTAERSMQSTGFFKVYPEYVPFNGNNYDRSQQRSDWCMGDYIFSAGYSTYKVVNCNEFVSLRKEANANTEAILTVPKGESVQVNGQLNGWMLCRYQGRYGWIKSDFLR